MSAKWFRQVRRNGVANRRMLLGWSRHLSVCPESTTAFMRVAAAVPPAGGDPARYLVLASALIITVGLLCLVAFAARLGVVADLLSKPILVGYLAGVAVTMMVGQRPSR